MLTSSQARAAYEPHKVYLLQKDSDRITLGEIVEHRYADETPGVEQACVYVALVNSVEEIYLQHRARTKRLWPDRRTISASGHVDPGETFEQAAVREVQEELGIELKTEDLSCLGFFTGLPHCGPVYEVRSDLAPRPAPEELDIGKSGFLPVARLERMLRERDLFTPSGRRALEVWLAAHRKSRTV